MLDDGSGIEEILTTNCEVAQVLFDSV